MLKQQVADTNPKWDEEQLKNFNIWERVQQLLCTHHSHLTELAKLPDMRAGKITQYFLSFLKSDVSVFNWRSINTDWVKAYCKKVNQLYVHHGFEQPTSNNYHNENETWILWSTTNSGILSYWATCYKLSITTSDSALLNQCEIIQTRTSQGYLCPQGQSKENNAMMKHRDGGEGCVPSWRPVMSDHLPERSSHSTTAAALVFATLSFLSGILTRQSQSI